ARLVLAIDVSANRKAQEKLAASEKSFKSLIDHFPDPIFVFADGILTYVNKAFLKTFGYDHPLEVLGAQVLDLIAPGDRPRIAESLDHIRIHGPFPTNRETHYIRKNPPG